MKSNIIDYVGGETTHAKADSSQITGGVSPYGWSVPVRRSPNYLNKPTDETAEPIFTHSTSKCVVPRELNSFGLKWYNFKGQNPAKLAEISIFRPKSRNIITLLAGNIKPSNGCIVGGPKWRNDKSKNAAAAVLENTQKGIYWPIIDQFAPNLVYW